MEYYLALKKKQAMKIYVENLNIYYYVKETSLKRFHFI